MKKLFLLFFLLNCLNIAAQTSLSGKLTDESGEPVILGNLTVFKNELLVTKTETDFDGNYNIANLNDGTYNVEASCIGFQTVRVIEVLIIAGKANNLDIVMPFGNGTLEQVEGIMYKKPVAKEPCTSCSPGLTTEQIKNLPFRDIDKLKAQAAKKAKREKRKSRWFWNKNRGNEIY